MRNGKTRVNLTWLNWLAPFGFAWLAVEAWYDVVIEGSGVGRVVVAGLASIISLAILGILVCRREKE